MEDGHGQPNGQLGCRHCGCVLMVPSTSELRVTVPSTFRIPTRRFHGKDEQHYLCSVIRHKIFDCDLVGAMVLDPLTALGVASNAVQLVEFSSRIVSRGQKIYKSNSGTLAESLELEAVTNSLLKTNNILENSLRSYELHRPLVDEEKELKIICEGCESAGLELINALQKVKVQGKHRKWKSFRQALKSVYSKAQIDDLTNRLEGFRKLLDTHILVSLRCANPGTIVVRTPCLL